MARGQAPDSLLDTYHAERHAAGARLLRNTRVQALLAAQGEDLAPVRELLAELAEAERTAGPLAEEITAVSTRYPVTDPTGHPWEGRTVSDVPLSHGSLTGVRPRMRGRLGTCPVSRTECEVSRG